MPIDFPASPSTGQQYTYGGVNYTYTGTTWSVTGFGSGGVTSSTAPPAPTSGQLWYDLSTGILSIYVNDGTSSQWVQVAPGGSVPVRDAFKAYRGTDQTSITQATYTKVILGGEIFDDNNKFELSPNYRWTPSAGRVAIFGSIGSNLTTAGFVLSVIYKNAAQFAVGAQTLYAAGGLTVGLVNAIDNANGTDYYELYGYISTGSGGTLFYGGAHLTWLAGYVL